MTISAATFKNQYTGNGSNTVFSYTFKIYNEDDIAVLLADTTQTITTHYSVSGVGSDAGGSVTFVTAPASGVVVTLKRNEPLTQEIEYTEGDDFPATAHEEGLDRSAIRDQFLQEQIDRCVQLSEGSTVSNLTFDDPTGSAGLFLKVNDDEDGFDYVDLVDPGVLAVSAFMQTVLDDTTASAARTTLGAAASASPTLTGTVTADTIQTSGATGVILKNSGGTTVATVGASNGTVTTLAGALNVTGALGMTGKVNTAATASGGAGLNVPHGTAPSAPTNGDIWTTTTGLSARINSVTFDYGIKLATAQATTSGTAINFTGIPSGVKRIQVMFNAISVSGTSHFLVQIGDSGGIETSGYNSGSGKTGTGALDAGLSTAGFIMVNHAAAETHSGIMTLINISGNIWVESHIMRDATNGNPIGGGGEKTLSATLDRLTLTTVGGADTFDAGSVNILYE